MFTRSDSGIKNRKIFLEYDLLLLLEVGEDTDTSLCAEEKFWLVLVQYFTGLTVRTMKRGSKSGAIKYGKKLDEISENAYICALDRDFDDLWSPHEVPINTVYTWGYSFESDLLTAESIFRSVELTLGGHIPDRDERSQEIFSLLTASVQNLKFCIAADQICVQRQHGFFHREKRKFQTLLRACEKTEQIKPILKMCRARIKQIRPQLAGKARTVDLQNLTQRLYGKCYIWLAYKLASISMKELNSKATMSYKFFLNVVVDESLKSLENGKFAHDCFYRSQFNSITYS